MVCAATNSPSRPRACDHRNRCERLLDNYERSSNALEVKVELCACCDHAEKWEWARTEDPAPETVHIHRAMVKEYRNCLHALDGMDLVIKTSDAPAASYLNLLFGTDGGQVGWYVEQYVYYEG